MLEELTGWLKAGVDRLESQEPPREHGRLLTDYQWLEKMKVRQGSSSSWPAHGSGQRRRRPQRKSGGESGDDRAAPRDGPRDNTCHNCGRHCHWAKGQRQPMRNTALLAQTEEDDEEPSLLMVQVCATPAPATEVQDSIIPAPAMKVQDSITPAPAMVVRTTLFQPQPGHSGAEQHHSSSRAPSSSHR